MSRFFGSLDMAIALSLEKVKLGVEVDTGHWQGVSTGGKPDLVTRELMDWDWKCSSIPPRVFHEGYTYLDHWRGAVKPNLPWADDHFEERVSRVPSNPGEEYKNWPWWRGLGQEKKSMIEELIPAVGHTMEGEVESVIYDYKFTHTYQERFWPRLAGGKGVGLDRAKDDPGLSIGNHGIRYSYGDLDDVVNLLLREPYTRQAYFPIYFPEDTGSVHGGRTPCTLGYHFMLRNNELHMWYTIRSCDAVRHFRDDVYLALRLLLWVIEELRDREGNMVGESWGAVRPGIFHFKAFSFHVHQGDLHLL